MPQSYDPNEQIVTYRASVGRFQEILNIIQDARGPEIYHKRTNPVIMDIAQQVQQQVSQQAPQQPSPMPNGPDAAAERSPDA